MKDRIKLNVPESFKVDEMDTCDLHQIASSISYGEGDKEVYFSLDRDEGEGRCVDLKKDKNGDNYFNLKVIVKKY